MLNIIRVAILFSVFYLAACGAVEDKKDTAPGEVMRSTVTSSGLDEYGEQFVQLALALGVHDGDYVDAYHGDPAWRDAANEEALSLDVIQTRANEYAERLAAIRIGDPRTARRSAFLQKQFRSMQARAAIVGGAKMPFDEESAALYDAVSPTHNAAHYEKILAQLETSLPGEGELGERVKRYRDEFVVPTEKLDAVFKAAIAECRRRTLQHIELPENERFVVEYVNDKPWSAYNWYQGDAYSVIQVNTDFPVRIDRAVDLACHEGYPGHHVYNALLEENLLKGRGWQEFSVFPLFSPTGLIAEGSANYGIDMAFPEEERYAFEAKELFPLAGLDASRVKEYYATEALLDQLKYAGNDTARRYLDGEISAEEAAAELEKYALMTPGRAQQRVKFIEKYRSYVINYNLGRDMVAAWIEKGSSTQTKRWARFEQLLSEPYLPSQLN